MSFLSEIKNFIKTDVLGIKPDTKVTSADKKSEVKAPVIKVENLGKNEDVLVMTNTKGANVQPKKNLGQLTQSVELKCKANGINIKLLQKLFAEVAGLSKEQFESVSEDEKLKVLEAFDYTIDKTIGLKNQYGLSMQANTAEVVKAGAKEVYATLKAGEVNSVEEFEKEVGDINAELGGEGFKKLDLKARRAKMEELTMSKEAEFEKNLQEALKSVPEEKRGEYEAQLRSLHNRARRARFNEVLAVHDTETANTAIVTLHANDMAYGAKTVLATRVNAEEKTRAADMQTFDFFESNLKAYYERGEEIEASVVEEYHSTTMEAKSYNAAQAYQDDYKTARLRFESGEDVPPYLSKEIFTATAQGIGKGALNNVNMTTGEKAEFIAKWEADAKDFSDYEEVTKAVKEETAAQSKEVSKNTTPKPEKKSSFTYVAVASIANEAPKSEEKTVVSNPISKETPKTTSTKQIAQKIKETSFEVASRNYSDAEVAKAVLNTPQLTYLRPLIAGNLKNFSVEQLRPLIGSTSALLFVLRNISPEKAMALYEDNKQNMCYDARTLGENIIEEHKEMSKA